MKDIEYLNNGQINSSLSYKGANDVDDLHIIIVDDEDFLRTSLVKFISKIFKDFKVLGFENPTTFFNGISHFGKSDPFIIISDISFGDSEIDGLSLVDRLQKMKFSRFEVIMMTGFGSIESAINATKRGVFQYLTKPFSLEDMRGIVGNCFNKFLSASNTDSSIVERDNIGTSRNGDKLIQIGDLPMPKESDCLGEIIGNSLAMTSMYDSIHKISKSDSTVLIFGESGTGKELVARSIHQLSQRTDFPLININCGAIPSEILESELFGHVKGAFTGAVGNRVGKFEASSGGSILLDEIGDMPLLLQVKLLRVLQTKTIEPVGSNISKKINTRLIAATHKDIAMLVREGKFREDLYYRLNVIPIRVPALRERRADIPLLIAFFLKKYTSGNLANLISFRQDTFDYLCRYDWPGNVRELENLVERLIILKGGNIIEPCDLPKQITLQAVPSKLKGDSVLPTDGIDLKEHLLDVEKSFISQALKKTNGNKNQASKLLGLNRTTLIEKLKKMNLSQDSM